ncbi:MAG: DNA mismatch repair protein MutS [Nitrospinae bacterium]|nr:DNA mismatch repair protein MutS [Nitrospinota bacterium]
MSSNLPQSGTPMMKQYLAQKERYPDAILFFRMGDFYEMFFEDAKKASKILEIALTSRSKSEATQVPMCGIPYHAADNYIGRLIKAGVKVAICEQVEDPKAAKGIVKREVVRVITPGALLDSSLLDARDNNFLASVFPSDKGWGVAFADVSTGDFRATEFHGEKARQRVLEELEVLKPKEVLVPEAWKKKGKDGFFEMPESMMNYYPDWTFEYGLAYSALLAHFKTVSLEGYGAENMPFAVPAAGAVVHYLNETQKASLGHIHTLSVYNHKDYMALDAATIRNLELARNSFDGSRSGSLLEILDLTATPMGGRCMKDWVLKPLLDLASIQSRHSAVEELVQNPFLRQDVREALKSVHDMERIIGRVVLGAANGRDLVALRGSIAVLPFLAEKLGESSAPMLQELRGGWDDLRDVGVLVWESIVEEPPLNIREGGIIKEGYSAELDELRTLSREGKTLIASLEAKEKEKTGINTLKVRYNKIYGYYIEVTKKSLEQTQVPLDYIRKQSLVNAERFISPELKEFESKVLNAEEKAIAMEEEIFRSVREKIAKEAKRALKTAGLVAALDALAALAEAAVQNRYVRPSMSGGDALRIRDGRHPVIERIPGGDPFVPNDTHLDTSRDQIAIITGPNMAGKSTYLRQTALIVLMAQVGSFVPAAEAEMGIVDRIFTRVGAQDNLFRGQSTFMVEMNETANILNNATDKSLIILDEIGRGTSTFDGLSIAWSVVEYLHNAPGKKAKTLFATHYHELTELAELLERVKNYNILVREWNDEIIFLRKIEEGGADKSYGIQVARLAGLPAGVLDRAREVLHNLENREYNESGKPRIGVRKRGQVEKKTEQLSLFGNRDSEVMEELKGLDIENMTPLEAMKNLDRIKKMF